MATPSVCICLSVALLGGAASAFAADSVDLQIRPKEKVDGTLYPKEERDTFLVDVPRNARIAARVTRKGRTGPAPVLALVDGASSPVAQATPDPTGARLKPFTVDKSDRFGLRVQSDGVFDGDYKLHVSVAPQTVWPLSAGASVEPGGAATFPFAAPAGATVDITLTPAKESAFGPRIVQIDGPGGFASPVDGAGATPRRHKARGVALGPVGEYTVRVRNDGVVAGAFSIVVRVTPPRQAKSDAIDIRDESLTSSKFDDDSQVFGRVVDAAGGLVALGGAGTPLAGTSVSVPENTVSTPAIFAIQSTDDIAPSGTARKEAAGPSVKLLPENAQFDPPVTVTIPYDRDAYDDPANEVAVFTEDPVTHQPVEVPRSDLIIDTAANTVSFPASHFSRFQGRSPLGRPVKGQFVQLEMGGGLTAPDGGSATFGVSLFKGLNGRRSGNGFERALNRQTFRWDQKSVRWDVVAPVQDVGTITVVDDENVTLTDPVDGVVPYVRGRNPDVLIRRPAHDPGGAGVSVLLRRAKGAPTPSNLAGDWTAFVLEASATHYNATAALPDRGLDLTMAGQVAQLTFGLDAAVTARSSTKFFSDTNVGLAPEGTWRTVGWAKGLPAAGSFTIPDDGSNTVVLTMPLGQRTTNAFNAVTLYPVLRGEVLVGVGGSYPTLYAGAIRRLIVLVRARADVKSQHLPKGDWTFAALGLDAVDLAGPAPGIQDFRFVADDFVATHNADFSVTYAGRRDSYARDALGAPSFVSDVGFSVASHYGVALDGKYTVKELQAVGALTLRPNVYVATRFVKGSLSVGFGVLKRPTQ